MHLVWVPKYRKQVLTGEVSVRVRDLIRQIASEHELEIISGKVARDHVHVFLSYRPTQKVSQIMQWLKGTSSWVLLQEYSHLRRKFWGRHLWARGYLAVSSGTITDEMNTLMSKKASKLLTIVDFKSTPLKPPALQAGVV